MFKVLIQGSKLIVKSILMSVLTLAWSSNIFPFNKYNIFYYAIEHCFTILNIQIPVW